MKLTRLILACTLLLLVSVPVFALPPCGDCVNNVCIQGSYYGIVCYYTFGICETRFQQCSVFGREKPVLTDWTVASIEVSRPGQSVEVSRPAQETEVVTASADVDEACTTEPAAGK